MLRMRPLLWVDIGMWLFVVVFLALALLIEGGLRILLMLVYLAALTIWAFVAEIAAVRHERSETTVGVDAYSDGLGVT